MSEDLFLIFHFGRFCRQIHSFFPCFTLHSAHFHYARPVQIRRASFRQALYAEQRARPRGVRPHRDVAVCQTGLGQRMIATRWAAEKSNENTQRDRGAFARVQRYDK